MDKDGEDDSTKWIGMGRMTAPNMDRNGEEESFT
jgi:hypothetical protein